MHCKPRTLCAAIAALGLNVVHAAEPENVNDSANGIFSVRGYGTVGLAHSNYKNADFRTDATVPNGAGRSHQWSASQMSRLGLQVDANVSDQWSASVQGVSEQNYKNSYAPTIVSAYVKYQPSNALALRAGRMVLPLYMLTDFSRVGYSLPWAISPMETYKQNISYDGADAIYKFAAGSATFAAQGFVGGTTYRVATDLPSPVVKSKVSDIVGLNLTADVGASTFRAMYTRAKIRAENSTLSSIANTYVATGNGTLADQYFNNNEPVSFASLGYSYDPGTWFLRTEITRGKSESDKSLMPSQQDFYLAAGYHFGKFTPYAIYGKESNRGVKSIGATDPLGVINASLAGNDASRHSLSAGLRWDFSDRADFKVQFSRITRDTNTSNLGLIKQTPGTTPPSHINLIFAGIDFLF